MQVVVLGMHRSGTSALARLLNLAGCDFGPAEAAMPANVDNPLGFWERQDVYELHEWVLATSGATWDRPLAFDPAGLPTSVREEFQERAALIVASFSGRSSWFIKDPRMCVTLPLWRPLLARPVCVHIVRHPLEVAASLAARNGLPIDVGLALWEFHVVRARRGGRDLPWVGVRHHDLLADPVGALADVVHGLRAAGVRDVRMPLASTVTGFISTSLHRHRWSHPDVADWIDCPQARLFASIAAADTDRRIPETPSSESMATLARHTATAHVIGALASV
jgi:hypothetical protein